MNSGIYRIRNVADGKMYIGRTTDLTKREKTHFWMLKANRHFNIHLQRAYNLNPDALVFEVLEECDKNLLNEKEVFYIALYKTMDMKFGYNLCEGGKSTTGRKFSEETLKKMSENRKGIKFSQEVIERRKRSLKEHIERDPEFAAYYREYCGKGARNKPSWNKGRKASEETRKKLSLAQKGKKKMSDSQKKKLSELYKGEKSITAILTEQEAINLKIRFLNGEPRMDIARSVPKVSPQTVYDCVTGRRWKHLPNSIKELERLKYGREIS